MKVLVSFVILCVLGTTHAKVSHPKVQVYSRDPGEYGKENTLNCYVHGFHPPDISIQLLKNGMEMPNPRQTDLAFHTGWQFHLLRSIDIKPESGDEYTCKVRHLLNTKIYTMESDM